MDKRREVILQALREEYHDWDVKALSDLSEQIDTNWHIIKKRALTGANDEWTLTGQVQSIIWGVLAGGAQSASAANKIVRRLGEEHVL